MKTILWHLQSRGFSLDSKNIDIAVFYDHLNEIVGNIADIILEEVYTNLKSQYTLDGDKNIESLLSKSESHSVDPIIFKIQELENFGSSRMEGFGK